MVKAAEVLGPAWQKGITSRKSDTPSGSPTGHKRTPKIRDQGRKNYRAGVEYPP